MSKAAQQFGEARKQDLAQLAVRIPAIFALPEEEQRGALIALRMELPRMLRSVNRAPKTAPVLANLITAAFFNGVDDAAEERKAA